jgi:hypothetical protein
VVGGVIGGIAGGIIRPGTGDLGKEGEAPGTPGSDWGPNKNFNGTTPGWLPATDRRPSWWNGTPIEGPATRSFTNKWCCCDGKAKVSESDGSPKLKKPAK